MNYKTASKSIFKYSTLASLFFKQQLHSRFLTTRRRLQKVGSKLIRLWFSCSLLFGFQAEHLKDKHFFVIISSHTRQWSHKDTRSYWTWKYKKKREKLVRGDNNRSVIRKGVEKYIENTFKFLQYPNCTRIPVQCQIQCLQNQPNAMRVRLNTCAFIYRRLHSVIDMGKEIEETDTHRHVLDAYGD